LEDQAEWNAASSSRCSAARLRGRSRHARQQGERMRRIGVLLPQAADDPEAQARVGAFLQALAQLGWTIGRNLRIETRWGGGKDDVIRKHAVELAALALHTSVRGGPDMPEKQFFRIRQFQAV
jgi:hypothetical protein